MIEWVIQFGYFIVALLVVMSVHEASHAFAAYYLGDPTAKIRGRLTLNPLAHLDPLGSLVFLLTQSVGWGKPVPVNYANFKHPMRDGGLTALAGPLSNFVLAFVAALVWKYTDGFMPDFLMIAIQNIFHVSIYLGLFNLFPFPPLDGSKIIGLLVPRRYGMEYERYLVNGAKYFVVIILVDVFILPSLLGFSVFVYVMSFLHQWVSLVLFLGT